MAVRTNRQVARYLQFFTLLILSNSESPLTPADFPFPADFLPTKEKSAGSICRPAKSAAEEEKRETAPATRVPTPAYCRRRPTAAHAFLFAASATATSHGTSLARHGVAACLRTFVGIGAISAPITAMPSTTAITATATEGRATPMRSAETPSKAPMPVCVGG